MKDPVGENAWPWLRSPDASNATSFCYVYSDGAPDHYGASNTCGVAFGFCV